MSFKSFGMRASVLASLGIVTAALLLASCGGGQQVEKFVPVRVLAFGDENSLIEANGDKYTNNFKADANTARDCNQNQIWVQSLASAYALLFPQCNTSNSATTSKIFATLNAKSADVNTQITGFLAGPDSFGSKDLVTILAGAHDVLEQYNAISANTTTEDQAGAVLDQRGADLADQVNFIAKAGGKVLIATVQDMGLTPFAIKESAAHTDFDRAALLTRLTARFNTKLRINLINDGHMIGLLLFDEQIQALVKTSGWVVDKPACLATLASVLACDSTTMVDDVRFTPPIPANGSSWLWADDTHISSGGHTSLGSLALTRASNNPF